VIVAVAVLATLAASPMNESISDDVFWSSDPAARVGELAPPRDGLELLAPRRVELDARRTLPVVLRRKVALRDDMQAPLPRFGIVVALDRDADVAFAGLATAPRDGERPFRAPDDQTLARVAPAVTTRAIVVDLREALGIPWHPANLVAFGAARRMRSEPVTIRLEGQGAPGSDASGERDLADVSWTPGPGDAKGLALSADAAGTRLRGSYRIRQGSAIHLVFSGDTWAGPTVWRLQPKSLQGGFAVETTAVPLGSPQTYTVWAVAGDAIAGPATVRVTK
jgi:hypothetical protein